MSSRAPKQVVDDGRQIAAGRLYAVAIGAGAALWMVTALAGDRREAWDSPLYWSVTYPLCIALAAVLGYAEPTRPWRWALALMLVQPVVMALTSGSDFGLLPLGLIMFGVLALPPVLAARIGAWLRSRTKR